MKRAVWLAGLLAATLAPGCRELPERERPVARVNGESLTRGDLEEYFRSNLAEQVENDTVRSRLLDRWIDETLLFAEASARRLTIPDESLEVLLDEPGDDVSEEELDLQRENLRRRLMIGMLQGQVLQDIVPPSTEQAEAWLLEQSPETPGSGRRVELRSLRFDDAEQALAVHRSLRRDRVTYNEAILQNTEDESQGATTVVEYESLPAEVQEVIGDLRSGWSSKPVEVGGSTYLFQVVRWIGGDREARTEAAREEMFAAERRTAWEAYVAKLRAGASVRILQENLPFRYASP